MAKTRAGCPVPACGDHVSRQGERHTVCAGSYHRGPQPRAEVSSRRSPRHCTIPSARQKPNIHVWLHELPKTDYGMAASRSGPRRRQRALRMFMMEEPHRSRRLLSSIGQPGLRHRPRHFPRCGSPRCPRPAGASARRPKRSAAEHHARPNLQVGRAGCTAQQNKSIHFFIRWRGNNENKYHCTASSAACSGCRCRPGQKGGDQSAQGAWYRTARAAGHLFHQLFLAYHGGKAQDDMGGDAKHQPPTTNPCRGAVSTPCVHAYVNNIKILGRLGRAGLTCRWSTRHRHALLGGGRPARAVSATSPSPVRLAPQPRTAHHSPPSTSNLPTGATTRTTRAPASAPTTSPSSRSTPSPGCPWATGSQPKSCTT